MGKKEAANAASFVVCTRSLSRSGVYHIMLIMWYMLRIVHIKTTTKLSILQPHFCGIGRKRLGGTSAGVGNSFRSRPFFVLSRLISVVCGRFHHIINIM